MDSVKFIRALASLCGSEIVVDEQVKKLKEKIGVHEHYLFLLLDGFGNYLLEKNPKLSFFKERRSQILRSVFPSTTASALSSFGTAQYPSQHGAIGWWTHLAEEERTVVYLPFTDRQTGKHLSQFGIESEKMYYEPSYFSTLKRRSKCYVPAFYVDSEFSRYSRGDTLGQGYKELQEALNSVEEFAFNGDGASYQYLYFPQIDSTEHRFGTDAPEVHCLAEKVCLQVEEFYKKTQGKIRIVITADHGLIDIPEDNNFLIDDEHPLMPLLKVPPACETRVPMFFLKDLEQSKNFVSIFNEYFDQHFVLVSKNEARERDLFGPKPWHPIAEKRIGDFIALPRGPWTLQYHGENYKPLILKGVHGALSPEETQVPLILI